jgi:type II secretion system protein G
MRIKTDSSGFTIIELMMVIVIIGLIAAITIPNYMKFSKKAKEAVVQENVHTVQLALENFSVDRLGQYPQAGDEAELMALMPGGSYPDNPFTNAQTVVTWEADPVDPGTIGIFNLPGGGYMIRAQGATGFLDDVFSGD